MDKQPLNILKHPNNTHNKYFSVLILPNILLRISMRNTVCGKFHVESATLHLQDKSCEQEKSFLWV